MCLLGGGGVGDVSYFHAHLFTDLFLLFGLHYIVRVINKYGHRVTLILSIFVKKYFLNYLLLARETKMPPEISQCN